MRHGFFACGTLGLFAAAGLAQQPVVVPAANSTAPGTVAPADTLFREFARTHQQVISASALASIPVGASITQITFRASNFGSVNALGSWPASTLEFADYEVYLARAARAPGSMSQTLSENVVPGSQARVRDGSLSIPAGAFANFVAPPGVNPWGLSIQISPFVYSGGDLVLTIRHSGHLRPLTPRVFMDSVANPLTGTVQCISAPGMGATSGSPDQSMPAVLRLRYVPPPSCYANCDGSVGPLTPNDFVCFINTFLGALNQSPSQQVTSYANCDGSTSFPVLNIGDLVCFNNRFAAGCS